MAIEANVDIEFGQGGSELEKQKLEIHWWYIFGFTYETQERIRSGSGYRKSREKKEMEREVQIGRMGGE